SRFAFGLHDLGVRAGDSVAVMLPNCIDFAALIFAINQLGAIYTGIPVGYGELEVEVILRRTGAAVIVAVESFGSSSPIALVRKLRLGLPTLRHVVVSGPSPLSEGELTLASLLDAPPVTIPDVDPSALCHVGFTSGTTGEPKGVMNTHQTLYAVLRNWVAHVRLETLGEPFVNLVASPIGHHTGFLWGVLLTTYVRGTAIYLDRWNPDRAADIVREEGVTTMFGAPTFLQDLLLTNLAYDSRCTLRTVILAGSPVPRTLPAVAGAAFGCYVCPAWGMTELGIGISCASYLPDSVQTTDGVVVPGSEMRVVGLDGKGALLAGSTGLLEIRGPGLFLGYLQRPDATAEAINADGWFNTGDTARLTAEGYVILEGRTKDIVIRGGENIPVVVVESLLFQHPQILEASVVGLPDPRFGERACAVVVLSGDTVPTLDELCLYLLEQGLSKHFLPERLEVVSSLPKTPSGKIRKAQLRKLYTL
ncbi:MAG: AMP-binding protein, partial [Actinobacteria bacterium]|nr:AMP-binding protein [Actinomycetota bacterium]